MSGSTPNAVVAFTGTQRDMTEAQKEVLLSALIGFREGGAVWMHNGDCIEADKYAGDAWRTLGGKIHLHPPSNPSKRAFLKADIAEPPRPYMARNERIAARGTALVATPRQMTEQPNGGTWFTIRAARKRGIPAMIILPNGKVVYERWPCDSDAAEGGDADAAPVPQDQQARAEGIAQVQHD